MHAYHGRYLRIDLSTGTSTWRPLAEDVLRRFLGGVGLGAYLLHQEAPPGVAPLAPDAPLLFVLSPLVGTPLTTSAKFAVVAKSPLTHRLNDALASSHFALAAKRAGMDALAVVGKCERPSVLLVDDGRVRIEPADAVWGMTCPAAEDQLRQRFGPRFEFAVIGPAGEKLVRYATISHGSRHAGRGGAGAVMGSKRLKAIAVAGTQHLEVADPDGVMALAKDISARSLGPATAKYRELGTLANMLVFNRLALLPTRNFQETSFQGAAALSHDALASSRKVTRESCAACTIGCEHIYEISEQASQKLEPAAPARASSVRLEYETLYALGPLCGIDDPDVVLRAARRCDELGLDTISTGATIAFAMECSERGLLQSPPLAKGGQGGLELHFANGPAMLDLIERIALRDGLGDVLAEGTRCVAAQLGGNAADFAPHVKGLELPGYEPRVLQTMALGLAVGSRGADHNRSGAYEADFSPAADRAQSVSLVAQRAVETEDRAALLDSLILCKFLRGVFSDLWAESAELLRHVTGWDVTAEELHLTAQRIVAAKKLYNIREGWTAAEDTLPRRFLAEGATLSRSRLEALVQAYYAERGWDRLGCLPDDLRDQLHLVDIGTPMPATGLGIAVSPPGGGEA
jgi:aldehyde:ferredoxin oxidoreductase